jgi:nucleoside-diphosphate-sugar epimerase
MPCTTAKHIVITGAGGFIGTALVQHFSRAGYVVTALVRRLPTVGLPNVNYLLYDMSKPFDLEIFIPNSVLVHAAYLKKQIIKNGEDLNQLATQNLLKKAKKQGVKQCIFLSSISVLANTHTYYAQQKRAVEKLFDPKVDTILRLGLVIGKGGLFYESVKILQKTRLLPLLNQGRQTIYYLGINDLVQHIELCIQKNSKGTKVLCHANPMTHQTFYKTIAKHFRLKIVTIPIPVFLLRLALFLGAFMPKSPITKDNLEGLLASNVLPLAIDTSFECSHLEVILTELKW